MNQNVSHIYEQSKVNILISLSQLQFESNNDGKGNVHRIDNYPKNSLLVLTVSIIIILFAEIQKLVNMTYRNEYF